MLRLKLVKHTLSLEKPLMWAGFWGGLSLPVLVILCTGIPRWEQLLLILCGAFGLGILGKFTGRLLDYDLQLRDDKNRATLVKPTEASKPARLANTSDNEAIDLEATNFEAEPNPEEEAD
jgi:hypothetical protein